MTKAPENVKLTCRKEHVFGMPTEDKIEIDARRDTFTVKCPEKSCTSHAVIPIRVICDYLGIPAIAALEVATFYNMYDLKPVGEYKITICTNISCMLRDADTIVDHLQSKLGVGFNEVTPDGKFCLKEGECMGCCGGAPLMHINNTQMHEFLTVAKVDEILGELK